MKKSLLALGILLSFVGLSFMAASQIVVKPEPQTQWETVQEVSVEKPTMLLSVQGQLKEADEFKVYFQLAPLSGQVISWDASVEINFTDPGGNMTLYDIPIGLVSGNLVLKAPFPQGVANYTGTYKVDAEGIWGMYLIYLALQKMKIEETEPQHPYGIFIPVGVVVFLAGGGIFLLGAKASKHKRRLHKHKGRLFSGKSTNIVSFSQHSTLR
jgi:hypothetical protein